MARDFLLYRQARCPRIGIAQHLAVRHIRHPRIGTAAAAPGSAQGHRPGRKAAYTLNRSACCRVLRPSTSDKAAPVKHASIHAVKSKYLSNGRSYLSAATACTAPYSRSHRRPLSRRLPGSGKRRTNLKTSFSTELFPIAVLRRMDLISFSAKSNRPHSACRSKFTSRAIRKAGKL